MAYADSQGGMNGEGSWIESAISDAAGWVVSLFGGQAEERDRRRMAQNEAAFRAAAAGGTADEAFLRARTGQFGTIDIPVRLPYAVSPSSGQPETPGQLSGWATGPARRHAQLLFERLLQGGTDVPANGADPAIMERLYGAARDEGRDAAERLLQTVAAGIYGQIPPEYRAAIERGVRDHYAGEARGTVNAALPWIIGAGIGLAVLRRRR